MSRLAEPPPRPRVAPETELLRDRREFRTNVVLMAFVHLVLLLAFFIYGRLQPKPKVEQIVWLNGGEAGGRSAAELSAPSIPEVQPEPEPEPEPEPPPLPKVKSPPVPEPEPVIPPKVESELALPKPTPEPATPKPHTPEPATPKPATPKPATPKPATPKPATPKPTPKPKPATPKPKPVTPKPAAKPKSEVDPKPTATPSAEAKNSTPNENAATAHNGGKPTANQSDKAGTGSAKGAGSGTGKEGRGTGAGKPSDFGWYFSLLRDRFYAVWIPPTVPDAKALSVTIKFRVKRDGTILSFEMTRPSGNSLMDGSVLEAARQVTKLDPLPEGLGKEDVVDIPVNFEPE